MTAGREYRVVVRVPEEVTKPMLKGLITIVTDDPEQQTLSIRFFGRAATPGAQHGGPTPRTP